MSKKEQEAAKPVLEKSTKDLKDARNAIPHADVTGAKDYERVKVETEGSKLNGVAEMPEGAAVVPVSGPGGAPVDSPEAPFGTVLSRDSSGEYVPVTPPPVARTNTTVKVLRAAVPGMDEMDEAAVLGRLEVVAAATHRKHPFAPTEPATVEMDLGLQCLRLMSKHGVLDKEETQRLANRVNVLLRAHPPMQLSVQVSE